MTTEEKTAQQPPQEEQSEESKKGLKKIKGAVIGAIDENGNGEVDIEDVIIKGLKLPGIHIDREEFLRKQLMKWYPEDIIDIAIAESPMKAKIPLKIIDKLADDVIQYERNCVSGISAALGVPGGWAMVATIPADIAQYYGYLLRATQKLLYLYGFSQIDTQEKGPRFDDGTMNTFILCFGVMYGTAGANNALKAVAKALGTGVEKELLKRALTKGTVYPVVQKVAKWFGVKMTKDVFAGFFKNTIPLVGGLLGGGITYLSFKPCCDRLKKVLRDTILSNPRYIPSTEDDFIREDNPTDDTEESTEE